MGEAERAGQREVAEGRMEEQEREEEQEVGGGQTAMARPYQASASGNRRAAKSSLPLSCPATSSCRVSSASPVLAPPPAARLGHGGRGSGRDAGGGRGADARGGTPFG